MEDLYSMLMKVVRFEEGLKACMNCGICTGICPAAEYYNYDPRRVMDLVQTRNNDVIRELLMSDTIWYCGQCMSCKTRCPRGNTPGMVIMALRRVSQQLGYFTASEKGRQQFAIKRTVGDNVLKYGYCIVSYDVDPEAHPEQGPVWEWLRENREQTLERFNTSYGKNQAGTLRNTSRESLDDLKRIFDETGGTARFNKIEECSAKKAAEGGKEFSEGRDEYFNMLNDGEE